MAHGNRLPPEQAALVAATALQAVTKQGDGPTTLYYDLVVDSLSEAARKAFDVMNLKRYEYKTEFARKYVAEQRDGRKVWSRGRPRRCSRSWRPVGWTYPTTSGSVSWPAPIHRCWTAGSSERWWRPRRTRSWPAIPDTEAFAAYRRDPELAEVAGLRAAAIATTRVVIGYNHFHDRLGGELPLTFKYLEQKTRASAPR
jgi:hypothetical protein